MCIFMNRAKTLNPYKSNEPPQTEFGLNGECSRLRLSADAATGTAPVFTQTVFQLNGLECATAAVVAALSSFVIR